MNITLTQLQCIMPYAGPRAPDFLPWLNRAMDEFDINTKLRQAPFLAQLAHETAQLAHLSENLNYSAEALMRTWPKRFPTLRIASGFAHMPEQIANCVYGNRMGNGDMSTGDGWRYRGAGAFQLTGKDNQRACADHFGIPVEQVGDWLRTPEGACRSAAWFWDRAGCNAMADRGDFDAISDAINIGHDTRAEGDAIGYADRLALSDAAMKVLA